MITIIGLGTTAGDLTLSGLEKVKAADVVVLQTDRHPAADVVRAVAKQIVFLDDVYNDTADFDALSKALAARVKKEEQGGRDVAYCVSGSGAEDRSAMLLGDAGAQLIGGVPKGIRQVFVAKDTNFTYFNATDFVERKNNLFDTNHTLVITELNDRLLAGDIKLKLLDIYGESHPAVLNTAQIMVCEIDRAENYDDNTVLALLPLSFVEKKRFTFGDLIEVIYRLRDPDGCQWDRAQTHQSIRGNTIEEAYELVEAVDLDDIDKMREESGDVVLQGIFHAIIADSHGEYNVNDVISDLTYKLISRHTHIFGENKANNTEEALMFWEAAKAKEKGYHSVGDKLDSVPVTFSALMSAFKSQKIAAKFGFEFETAEAASLKIAEELQEFFEASDQDREKEGGDLLFAAVNVLRMKGIDPELALLGSVKKFQNRVKAVSELLEKDNKTLKDCTAQQFDALWAEVKRKEHA